MNEVKAIPAEYEGVQFRSRLEARWAVYLDTVGIKWLYEYEGFQLPSGWYLPDFYLPNEGIWLEIKPGEPSEVEIRKAKELAKHTNRFVFMHSGPIGSHQNVVYVPSGASKELRYGSTIRAINGFDTFIAVRLAQRYSFWPVKEKDKVIVPQKTPEPEITKEQILRALEEMEYDDEEYH